MSAGPWLTQLNPASPLPWYLARPDGAANSLEWCHAKIFPVVAAMVQDLGGVAEPLR